MTRLLSWLIGITTLLGAGAYVLIYLYRWEWHRALICAAFFLAAEIAVSVAVLLRRLDRIERRLAGEKAHTMAEGRDPRVLAHIQHNRVSREPFAWLRRQANSTNVFIPILLGSGALLSGVAWLVERTAGGAARGHLDGRLARELAAIEFPAGDLVPGQGEALVGRYPDDTGWDATALRLLLGPAGGR